MLNSIKISELQKPRRIKSRDGLRSKGLCDGSKGLCDIPYKIIQKAPEIISKGPFLDILYGRL
jgi:hypothetical protein